MPTDAATIETTQCTIKITDPNSTSHSDHDDDEEEEQPFVKVTSKRGRSKNFRLPLVKSPASLSPDPDVPIDEDHVKRQLAAVHLELTQSPFYRDALRLLRTHFQPADSVHIVCIGIGRFADCHIARSQLAFILAVRRDLSAAATRIQFHEPVLSAAEQRILRQLHCDWHPRNVEGKHRIASAGRTLAFLPHCPKQLTNNFLWANWSADRLARCALLCNSFQQLHDSTPQRFLAVDAAYIVRLQAYTLEQPLRNTFQQRDCFNDTALHTFQAVPADGQLCEPNPVEPVYPANGSELITAQLDSIRLQ